MRLCNCLLCVLWYAYNNLKLGLDILTQKAKQMTYH